MLDTVDNISSSCPISYPSPDLCINTDAFLLGWSAVCHTSKAQGIFFPEEIQNNGVILMHWSFWQLSMGFSVLKI